MIGHTCCFCFAFGIALAEKMQQLQGGADSHHEFFWECFLKNLRCTRELISAMQGHTDQQPDYARYPISLTIVLRMLPYQEDYVP